MQFFFIDVHYFCAIGYSFFFKLTDYFYRILAIVSVLTCGCISFFSSSFLFGGAKPTSSATGQAVFGSGAPGLFNLPSTEAASNTNNSQGIFGAKPNIAGNAQTPVFGSAFGLSQLKGEEASTSNSSTDVTKVNTTSTSAAVISTPSSTTSSLFGSKAVNPGSSQPTGLFGGLTTPTTSSQSSEEGSLLRQLLASSSKTEEKPTEKFNMGGFSLTG